MAFLQSLFGSSGQLKTLDRFKPNQQGLQNQAISQFGPLLQNLQKPADIEPILNQRRQSFNEQTIPSIAERFSSLGGGSQRSSAFQNALGRAGSDLETQLASLQSQVGLQDLNRQQGLLGLLSQLGMQPSFEHFYQPGETGLLGHAAQGAGMGLGLYAGGLGAGALGGIGEGIQKAGGLSNYLSSIFGGRKEQNTTNQSGSNNNWMNYFSNLLPQFSGKNTTTTNKYSPVSTTAAQVNTPGFPYQGNDLSSYLGNFIHNL